MEQDQCARVVAAFLAADMDRRAGASADIYAAEAANAEAGTQARGAIDGGGR
ncbi:hypothetical protein [Mesorhizobium sp. 128a]